MKLLLAIVWGLVATAFTILAGCAAGSENPTLGGGGGGDRASDLAHARKQLAEAAVLMNDVSTYLEEWGTVTMSAPVLSVSTEDFGIQTQSLDFDTLYAGTANAQGSVLVREILAFAAGLDISLELPTDVPLPGSGDGGGGDDGGGDSGGGGSQPDARARTNAAAAWLAKLTEGAKIQPGTDTDNVASQRRRIRQAASDHFELGLHRLLSNSERDKLLDKDSMVIYMAFTVSCQPGWRTQEGYVGQLDARVVYTSPDGTELSGQEGGRHPRVAAIYPAVDVQELDLESVRTQYLQFAFDLAVAGQLDAAKLFFDVASQVDQQASTRTGLTLATSFANGGRDFGYDFYPTYRALEDPASSHARPGYRLDPITFPAVAVAVISKRDAEPFTRAGNAISGSGQNFGLKFEISHTWRPVGSVRRIASRPYVSAGRRQRLPTESFSAALELGEAFETLSKAAALASDYRASPEWQAYEHLKERWHALQGRSQNINPVFSINLRDAFGEPLRVDGVTPSKTKAGADTTFWISGAGFGGDDGDALSVLIAGDEAGAGSVCVVDRREGLVQAKTPGALLEGRPSVVLEVRRGEERAFTPKIELTGWEPKPEKRPSVTGIFPPFVEGGTGGRVLLIGENFDVAKVKVTLVEQGDTLTVEGMPGNERSLLWVEIPPACLADREFVTFRVEQDGVSLFAPAVRVQRSPRPLPMLELRAYSGANETPVTTLVVPLSVMQLQEKEFEHLVELLSQATGLSAEREQADTPGELRIELVPH